MNQKEKCRKEVVREENKRRLFFLPVYIRISWEHMLPVPPQEQLCLREKRPGGWFPVLRFLMFLILLCLNEGSPKGVRAGQGWAQQQSPNTWWLQTEETPSPSASSPDIHPNHIREGRKGICLRVLWVNSPAIFQFSRKLVCPEEALPFCVVPPHNWKSNVPRKRSLVCPLCPLPGWPELQPWTLFSICQQQLLIVVMYISTVIPAVLSACGRLLSLIRPRPILRVTMGTATPCPVDGKTWSCTGLSPPRPTHPPGQGTWAESCDMTIVPG